MTLQLEHSQLTLTAQALAYQNEQCIAERDHLQSTLRTMGQQIEHQAQLIERQAQQIEHQAKQSDHQRVHYEALLTEARADREFAIASDRQNNLVLRNHLLQAPRLSAPALKGLWSQLTS